MSRLISSLEFMLWLIKLDVLNGKYSSKELKTLKALLKDIIKAIDSRKGE